MILIVVKRRQTCLLLSPNRPFATFACIPIITFTFVLFSLARRSANVSRLFPEYNHFFFSFFFFNFFFALSFWLVVLFNACRFSHCICYRCGSCIYSFRAPLRVMSVMYVLVHCTEIVSYVSFHFIELSFSRAHHLITYDLNVEMALSYRINIIPNCIELWLHLNDPKENMSDEELCVWVFFISTG